MVILIAVLISDTSFGVGFLLSILVLVFLFSLLVSQFPVFPCVISSLFVIRAGGPTGGPTGGPPGGPTGGPTGGLLVTQFPVFPCVISSLFVI